MENTNNDDDPPELLVFTLGWSATLPGRSFVRELSRLTKTTCLPLPCDAVVSEKRMLQLEARTARAEVPVLCVYDATVGEDSACGPPMLRMSEWGASVARVLRAADENNHEVIFVFDRSHDGHTIPGHDGLRTTKGVADAFAVFP